MTEMMLTEDASEKLSKDIAEHELKMKKSAKANKKKSMNKYKIFYVETDEKTGIEKKVTMKKFYAKDDDEAYELLKKYRKIANPQHTYYYADTEFVIDYDKDGNVVKYDSVKESHEAWRKNESFFEKLSSWYDVNVRMRIHDFFYNKKSMRFLKKTGHHREESYSLDTHIIDDIIFNVPIIKADKHGYPQHFCDKAVLELHKNEKSFDLDEFYSKNNWKTDKNVEDLAMAMYQAELDKLLLNARLYVYYSSYGIIDETNNDEVELDKKWHKTLPYRPGRYKELDYRKLHALEDKCWNSVFNWMKAYGRFLWT